MEPEPAPVHYYAGDKVTACGLDWLMLPKVSADLFAATCPECVAALRAETSGG